MADPDETLVGTEQDDTLAGGSGNDALAGLGGNDELYGAEGNDTLDGGAGNDALAGGVGDDTYYFDRLSGNDGINEFTGSPDDVDTVVFGDGIGPQDLVVTRSGTGDIDLVIGIAGSSSTLLIEQWFSPELPGRVERFVFRDGTVLTGQDIEAMINHAPVANADAIAVDEDATTANLVPLLLANDTDADAGDTRTVTAVDTTGTVGTVAFDSATQTLTYSADAASQDALAAGETTSDTFTYILTDSHGETSTAVVTVTITGVNDAPVVAAAIADRSITENRAFAFQVPESTFSDVDAGDTLAYRAELANGAALPGWLAFDAATRTFAGTPGDGDLGTLSVRVRATDTQGASASDVFDISIVPITGTAGDDNLVGTDRSDTILGLAGNDTLDGGAGADSLYGGLGSDTYFFDYTSGNDTVFESQSNPGDADSVVFGPYLRHQDLVITRVGDDLSIGVVWYPASITFHDWFNPGVSSHVENFIFQSGDATLTDQQIEAMVDHPPVLDNPIADQSAVEDLPFTFTIPANTFSDPDEDILQLYLQGPVPSWLAFDYRTGTLTGTPPDGSAGTIPITVVAYDKGYLTASDQFNLVIARDLTFSGTDGADTLVGTAAKDRLLGLGGNDDLQGLRGNDTLDGGAGADTMMGGAGNDSYYVDDAGDVVAENANEGTDTVVSSIDYVLGANLENLTLMGSAVNATGNALNNTLTGNAAANTIQGGAGFDTLIGGAGDDVYIVSDSVDTIVENPGEGFDTVYAAVTFRMQDNLEKLVLTGTSSSALWGNATDNTIIGNAGNDTLDGGAGADTLIGGAGFDTYYVDNPGDVVVETDINVPDTVNSTVSYTLPDNVETLQLIGPGPINGTGNALNNAIWGTGDANVLDGGSGADTLFASSGNDALLGGDGNDNLQGDAGDDYLDGGTGNDSLFGGTGSDTYFFDRLSGNDRILELQQNPGDIDTVLFGDNIARQDLVVTRDALNNLLIGISGSSALLTINNWFRVDIPSHVERFVFRDGTALSDRDIEAMSNHAPVAVADAVGVNEDATTANLVLAANPGLSSWALTNGLTQFQLAGSDTAALGGDLAYQYGLNGALAGIGFDKAQDVVTGTGFGTQAQTLRPLASLQDGVTPLG